MGQACLSEPRNEKEENKFIFLSRHMDAAGREQAGSILR
jgi:hypothetical protein